jgi:hypothetical protein
LIILDLTAANSLSKAANLFVWNNYMHDVSYAYGFDENNGISGRPIRTL